MGLHASYHPIPPATLADFILNWHAKDFWRVTSVFREESIKAGREFYIGTSWHILDFIINPPGASIPELAYAVRGHEFPAPDGSTRWEPHMPSYDDEPWQIYTYVTAEEAQVIAQYLPLIDEAEFDARYVPAKMKGVYRRPMPGHEDKEGYFRWLGEFRDFYGKAADSGLAVLINIG